MNLAQNVFTLSEYKSKKNIASKKKTSENLFDIEASEFTKMMNFINGLPEILIPKEDLLKLHINTNNLSLVFAIIYLDKYLELDIDKISDNDIKNVSIFLKGIYDLNNPKETNISYIYNINTEKRTIWVDGYDLIQQLIKKSKH